MCFLQVFCAECKEAKKHTFGLWISLHLCGDHHVPSYHRTQTLVSIPAPPSIITFLSRLARRRAAAARARQSTMCHHRRRPKSTMSVSFRTMSKWPAQTIRCLPCSEFTTARPPGPGPRRGGAPHQHPACWAARRREAIQIGGRPSGRKSPDSPLPRRWRGASAWVGGKSPTIEPTAEAPNGHQPRRIIWSRPITTATMQGTEEVEEATTQILRTIGGHWACRSDRPTITPPARRGEPR